MTTAFQTTGGGPRKGLSRDEAKALCDRVLGYANADYTRVGVSSGVQLVPHASR